MPCLMLKTHSLEPFIQIDSDVGLLGIELATRRRNRLNGPDLTMNPDGVRIAVAQSFGNRPKYIHARSMVPLDRPVTPMPVESAHSLSDLDMAQIRSAATFFIATHAVSAEHPRTGGADVSPTITMANR